METLNLIKESTVKTKSNKEESRINNTKPTLIITSNPIKIILNKERIISRLEIQCQSNPKRAIFHKEDHHIQITQIDKIKDGIAKTSNRL